MSKKSILPLITIVTVVFNETTELKKTILSVINQSYNNFEYIIIDGGSSEETLDLIKKYQESIDLWVSDIDSGIYDAMNKGIDLSSGEWVVFMNCGDVFSNNDVLSDVSSLLKDNNDIVYGDVYIQYTDNRIQLRESRDIKLPLRIMPACHQAIITKTKLMKMHKFNLKYSLAADFDSLCNIVAAKGKVKKIPLVLATVSSGGVSDVKRVDVYNQYEEISNFYFGESVLGVIYYSWCRRFEKLKVLLKNIIR